MREIFDAVRVLLCLAFFIYASWSDLQKREVSNTVWVLMAPSAFTLTFLQSLIFFPSMLRVYALSFAITSAVSVALFYAGAFGGADAKALICLSLALPYPVQSLPPLNFVSPLFPLTVFSNAVLLAASTVLYTLTRNLIWKHRTGKKLFEGLQTQSIGRKLLTALCGYKVSISELRNKKHAYPLEDVRTAETGETERRLLVFPTEEKKKEIIKRILEAKEEMKPANEVWITPGLPLLVFITAGLILALTLGDIIWLVLSPAL